MPGTAYLYAFTDDGDVRLRLDEDDWAAFTALPRLPRESETPNDYVPPTVDVIDRDTERRFEISRWWCLADCGCAAWAEDITESWEAAWAAKESETTAVDEPLVAVTPGGGTVTLTLAPEDIEAFNAFRGFLGCSRTASSRRA